MFLFGVILQDDEEDTESSPEKKATKKPAISKGDKEKKAKDKGGEKKRDKEKEKDKGKTGNDKVVVIVLLEYGELNLMIV